MTRDSEMLAWAQKKLEGVRGNANDLIKYRRYIRNGSGLIITSGALQMLLFMLGKKEEIHQRVGKDLLSAPGMKSIEELRSCEARQYITQTRLLRKAVVYLKLTAEIAYQSSPEALKLAEKEDHED